MPQTSKLSACLITLALVGCAPQNQVPAPDAAIPMPLTARMVQTRVVMDTADKPASWNMAQIGKDRVQLEGTSRARIVVAVMDTGADPGHPTLAHRLYPGIDVVGKDVYRDVMRMSDYTGLDGNGHGTHVAGIVSQVSAGADVKVLPVKVIPNSGVGDDKLLTDGIERALAWRDPADPSVRVRIMNLSVSSPRVSERLKSAIKKATEAGVLVIGASGNEGRAVEFPAYLPEVLSVGATTVEDQIADYSCYGQSIDMAAPGGSDETPVYSTWPSYMTSTDYLDGVSTPHTVAGLVGTSMAAPHVSGTAAVLWSLHPGLSAQQVRSGLLAMADDRGAAGPDVHFGFGRLNFLRAFTGDRHDAR